MRGIISVVILVLLVSCSAPQNMPKHVDQPNYEMTYDIILHEYLIVTGVEQTILKFRKIHLDQIKNSIERVMTEQISRDSFKDESKSAYASFLINQALTNFTVRFEKEQQKLMPFEDIEKKIIGPAYKRHFSIEDLRLIIDFYKTPVGEKFVSSIDTLMQEIATKTNKEYGQKLSILAQKLAEEEFGKIQLELKSLDDK